MNRRDHLVRDRAQQRGLARLRIGEAEQVGVGGHVEAHRSEPVLVDADRQQVRRSLLRPGQLVEPDLHRQQPYRRRDGTGPGRRDPGDEGCERRPEPGGVGAPVRPREGGEHMELVRAQAPPRTARRDGRGHPAVDLGLGRITEAQLDAGPEQVLERWSDLRPAARGDHHVDPVGETRRREGDDRPLELLVVGPERRPAVDDEDDVGHRVAVGDATGVDGTAPTLPDLRDGPDPVGAEGALTVGEQRRHLGHRAPRPRGVPGAPPPHRPGGDPPGRRGPRLRRRRSRTGPRRGCG